MRIPPDLIKGDGLLAVKRYMNKTAHMVIFKVLVTDAALGKRGEYIRRFLADDEFEAIQFAEGIGDIKIIQHAAVIEGHILPDKKKRRHHN